MSHTKLSLTTEVGRYPSSRAKGAAFRRQLTQALANGAPTVQVDLQGVEAMSDSFADEVFGVLVAQRGKDWFKAHINLLNLTPVLREDLLAVLRRRSKPKSTVPLEALRA